MKSITSVHKGVRCLLGGFVVGFVAFATVQSASATDYALLVGVGNYDKDYQNTEPLVGTAGLLAPAADLVTMRSMLYASKLNTWNDETVTTLADAQARKGLPVVPDEGTASPDMGVRPWIAYYAQTLVEGDTFLFYFSGRGGNYKTPAGLSSFVSTYDANYSDAELAADLLAFQPGVRILVFTEASYSGAIPPLQETVPHPSIAAAVTSYMDTSAPNHAQVGWITATDFESESSANGNAGSIFTTRFCATVTSMVADKVPYGNGDNLVDAREAFLCTVPQVSSNAQIANAALCAQFVLNGDSYSFNKVELRGTTSPTLAASEPYTCVAIYTNGTQSAEYQAYLDAVAAYDAYTQQVADYQAYLEALEQFESGELPEEPTPVEEPGDPVALPEEYEFSGTREVVLAPSAVSDWGLDPASAGTFEDGVLTLSSVLPGDEITLSASGTLDGKAWNADLLVGVVGDHQKPYADALDNALVTWDPAVWSTVGDWFFETGITHDGEDALQSTPVDAGDTCVFSGSFNGRGVFSFWYKVDATAEDGLVVTIDGDEILRAVGSVDWTQAQSLVGPGDHTVSFTYSRQSIASNANLGRAWVDEVSFTPVAYSFDMDANANGWTTGGFSNIWERGVPVFGPASDRICWGTDLDGRYGDNVDCWLMSPTLSIDGAAVLTFRTWFDIDNTAWQYYYAASGSEFNGGWKTYLDGGVIEVSINGAGWQNISSGLTCPGNAGQNTLAGTSAGWVSASVPLPFEAIGQSVRVRFRFASDAYVDPNAPGSPAGWFIDDVAVYVLDTSDVVLVRTGVEDTATGNANGIVEPGESVWVSFDIANQGATDLTGLVGSVQCNIPGVTLPAASATVTYGDLAAGGHATGAPRLLVTVADTVAPGTLVRLVQKVKAADGTSFDLESAFTVSTAATLSGTVYEAVDNGSGTLENVPFAYAEIEVSGPVSATTKTAADGTYTVRNLPAGSYMVSAFADGYARPASVLATVPAANVDFVLGKAYATLDKTALSYELNEDDVVKDKFVIANRDGTVSGSIPLSFSIEFPEGRPAWLTVDPLEGTILPGATRAVNITVDASKAVADPRLSTVIRVISNDSNGNVSQDVSIDMVVDGLSDALDRLSLVAFEGTTFPYHSNSEESKLSDGYLERGEFGALSFTVRNDSLLTLTNLVVTSFQVIDCSDGASTSDIMLADPDFLEKFLPTVSLLPAEGEGIVSPALEVSINDSGVEDPVYTLKIVLENTADGTTVTLTGDYTVYDRYSAIGHVYSCPAVPPVEEEEEPEVPEIDIHDRVPVAEAIVYGIGIDGMVETVTLEDGSYVLHGLRKGYNKLYATRSTQSPVLGMSKPVVFADLHEDLPNAAYLDAFYADFQAITGIDPATISPNPVSGNEEGEEGEEESPSEDSGLDFYLFETKNALLEVVDYALKDENGNGFLEVYENFSLGLSVRNNGDGIGHAISVAVSPIVPLDGGSIAAFQPAPSTGDSFATEDLQFRPDAVATSADEGYEESLSHNLTADGVEGVLPVLVQIVDYRMNFTTGEWVPQGCWFSTFDLDVSDYAAIRGSVTLDSAALPATLSDGSSLNSVRVYLDKLDPEDPDKVLSTDVAITDGSGNYEFILHGDYDFTYVVRPEEIAGAITPEAVEVVPESEWDEDRVCYADFNYEAIQGLTIAPNPLEVTHSEGESTTATLTIDNQTGHDIEIENVVIRYERTAADMAIVAQAVSQKTALDAAVAVDNGTVASDDGLDVPGELFVTFRPGVSAVEQDAFLAANGLEVITRYRLVSAIHCRFDAATVTYDGLRASLLASGLVAKVDTVRLIQGSLNDLGAEYSDPLVDLQWALLNEGQTDGTAGADIHVSPLWLRGFTGSRDVIVAVHDTGVDINHPELAGNIWVNEAELNGEPGVDDDNDGYIDDIYGWNYVDDNGDVIDENGHGTHVAGIIGAMADGYGTIGVNQKVSILPIRIADETGSINVSSADLARSFEFMVDHGVQVCNCSWGDSTLFAAPVLANAVQAACQQGLLLVVAAGNEAMDCDAFPGTLYGIQANNMIVVAAADHDGKLASFSNYGKKSVNIAAPGVDVLSTYPSGMYHDGMREDADHVYMDGTSMAAPYVAGAAALLLSTSPDIPTYLVREAILQGACKDPNLAGWVSSSGRLDVEGAFRLLGTDWLVCEEDLPKDVVSGGTGTLEFSVNEEKRLLAGTYSAAIDIQYVIDGEKKTVSVPVTDLVTAGANLDLVSILVDDSANGDGDGFAEEGETVDLFFTIRNASTYTMANASGEYAGETAAFPDLVPGATIANSDPFTVTIPVGSADLTIAATFNGSEVSFVLPVDLLVRNAASVVGRVKDSAGKGVAGAIVEYWTSNTPVDADGVNQYAAAGRVTADENGDYRIDGLAAEATAYLRAIPEGYARSEIAAISFESTDSVTQDFAVQRGNVWYTNLGNDRTLEGTVPLNGAANLTFAVTNTTGDAVSARAMLVERKSVLLISDEHALDAIAPVIQTLGFDVDVLSDNYEFVNVEYGSYTFQNEEHIAYTDDLARFLQYDFVIIDLGGAFGGGRQLMEAEADAIQAYLERGGRVLLTGGNLLSRPSDRWLSSLFGDASMDRLQAGLDTALPEIASPMDMPCWELSDSEETTSFAGLSGNDALTLPGSPFAYDVATPALPYTGLAAVQGALESGEPKTADKLYRYESANGVLYYWGGNADSSDVAVRGVWQDVLRDILASELFVPVSWASSDSQNMTLAGFSTTEGAVSLDATGLDAGDYKATLLLVGPFDDAETSAIHVTLHVVRPLFTAYSNTGVTNSFGAFLRGDGQPGSFVYQLILTATGTVSEPDSTGLPVDGETVVATSSSGLYYGCFGSDGLATDLGQFSEIYEVPNDGTPVFVVVRAWTGPTPGAGAFWGDSQPYAMQFTEGETHNFGSWCVGTLFDVDGELPLDSNGDGIPDSYIVEHFPDQDPAADLVVDPVCENLQEIKDGSSSYFPYRVFATDRYVYALDNNQKRITVWTTVGNYGTLVGTFKPTGAVQFTDPVGMGLQPGAFRFAVADQGRHVVQVFDFDEDAIASAKSQDLTSAFTHVLTIGTPDTPFGEKNSQGVEGLFTAANGVAMAVDGTIYVADTGRLNGEANRRVLVFNADGTLRNAFQPSGDAVLVDPAGIDVDSATGDIYVANTGAGNIVRLSAAGTPLAVYANVVTNIVDLPNVETNIVERPNTTERYVNGNVYVTTNSIAYVTEVVTNGFYTETNVVSMPVGPSDVKVWNVGETFRLLVADRDGNAIHILDSNGKFVATFTNPIGSADTYKQVGNFRSPWGVFPIADTDEAWVADTRNNRLQHLKMALDGDQDGIDDTVEMLNGRDPTTPDDFDTDGDGITDAMELALRYEDLRPDSPTYGEQAPTDPENADSDGDGLTDFEEVNGGTNPLDPEDAAETVCTVTATAQPAEGGSVTGAGEYAAGTTATLTATAAEGWQFAGWQDGGTAATRDVRVGLYGNDYIALFERQSFVITVTFVDTNGVHAAGVPADETCTAYAGIAFNQDFAGSFSKDYAFESGTDSVSDKVYTEPFVSIEPLEDVTVTFVGILSEEPIDVEPPAITATAIAVENDTLSAEFATDATDVAQLWTFIDEATSQTILVAADSIEHLAAYRATQAMDGIEEITVDVTVDTAAMTFSFAGVDVAGKDALFIVGFKLP